ncbi:hypothetical protein GUJ93_ZPchr0004g38980 [Zizania palustris]|uniref:Uncharacterized protein n=1 Tax=Zizania palustris TaxID=103762 RepID=A0A8J5VZH7_ZIZPA|nr:hypothetical protein GUJ93_ZPchr0004g38980 [Zizania palustris]
MSITDYCCRLKGLADALRDVGEPVSDRTQVLNLIRGLSPRFATRMELLAAQVPFPMFASARSQLLLAEMRRPANNSIDTALLANQNSFTGNRASGGHRRGCGRGRQSGRHTENGGRGGPIGGGGTPAPGGGGTPSPGNVRPPGGLHPMSNRGFTPPPRPWMVYNPWVASPWASGGPP